MSDTISLSDLKRDLSKWKELFPVGTEVSFVLGNGVWVDLFTMTGKIIEVTDDSVQTFVVDINKPELLVMPQVWRGDENGEEIYRASVHGSMLMKIDECPEAERKWLDKGQSIIDGVGETVEGLATALQTIIDGYEDEHGHIALLTLNRLDIRWSDDDDMKQALTEAKLLFVDETVTMRQGMEKLKSILERIKGQ